MRSEESRDLELDRGGPPSLVDDDPVEAGSVAREMAADYRRLVESYRHEWGLSPADADARAREPGDPAWREAVVNRAPESLSWWELGSLAEQDPDLMHALWQRAKHEAARELASGHRAAGALEFMGTPWDRARFLAMRAAFREEWRPRGGVEDALIDAIAQAYTAYLDWLRLLHTRSGSEAALEAASIGREGHWQPPRVDVAAAVEEAAAMADRFHRMFLRSLRALRDLRCYAGPVIVQRAEQVNIGEKQVNVAAATGASPLPPLRNV